MFNSHFSIKQDLSSAHDDDEEDELENDAVSPHHRMLESDVDESSHSDMLLVCLMSLMIHA